MRIEPNDREGTQPSAPETSPAAATAAPGAEEPGRPAILGAATGQALVPGQAGDGAALAARHQHGDQGQAAVDGLPHYTAGQVADIRLHNPASTIDPDTVDMLIGEPVTSGEPHRAVRELEMEDGTVYRLLVEQVRP